MLNIFKISRVVDKITRPYAVLLYQKANYSSKFSLDISHNLKRFERLVHQLQHHPTTPYRILCAPRFYATCNDGSGKKKPPPKPPAKKKDDCKPPVCPPPKQPKEEHTGLYPYLDECPHSKKKPPPPCEEELVDEKKYIKYLILGLLLTAAALGTLYFIKVNTKKEEYKPKKPQAKCTRRKILDKSPPKIDEIPSQVPYLIIGGGTAAFSAFRAIKSSDPTAKVLMVTKECRYPYMRPPLSKEMWYNQDKNQISNFIFRQWNGSARSIFYEPEEFYIEVRRLMTTTNGGCAVARGYEVEKIDATNRTAYLKQDGYQIKYDKCLIATGSTPKSLPVVDRAIENNPDIENRLYLYRGVEDFKDLHVGLEDSKAIAIVGGGFLGSELACSLSQKGKSGVDVYQIIREAGNMAKVLPEYLSMWTMQKVQDEGVEVVTNASLVSIEMKDDRLHMMLSTGELLIVDQLILAIGVKPNTEMAELSDLEVEPDCGGYLVNTELQARSNLYIAGDCSCFYDARLGRRRIEHHDHAVVSGRLAGENMTGAAQPYKHQSMFWSDLGPDVGYEAIGIVDSSLPTVGVFAKATEADSPKAVVTATDEGIRSKTEEDAEMNREAMDCKMKGHTAEGKKAGRREPGKMQAVPEGEDFGKGVVFYLRDDIVVGIVLWNVFNRMSVARQVLDDGRKYEDLNEVAKLFNIHEE